ncbi:Uracil-DNA glycosylase-like protein [Glarea lozoyensis ATCC 20868]|uniref:Uracil-DNA glycosylase-like protein n=1 Tax=Glarea lozoyensis (strain ATCC 20868 / MF5171) TaxID=1116229 RepID=S3DD05_GLAL2|nr:Uracil-DNA glycosylase-like protein [Glarea lozoyensis ATCC 20868]EPE24573.1 Uracil-DNA glycosylase-like protein [Glarea lozoyensis ATCC 20868]
MSQKPKNRTQNLVAKGSKTEIQEVEAQAPPRRSPRKLLSRSPAPIGLTSISDEENSDAFDSSSEAHAVQKSSSRKRQSGNIGQSTPKKRKPSTPSKRSKSNTPTTPSQNPEYDDAAFSTVKKRQVGYEPPSVYAHLAPLTDIIGPNLLLLFIGTNPGISTATAGHAYAYPQNKFWKIVHESGITPYQFKPQEDRKLLDYSCGNTNLVDRPTPSVAQLSAKELTAGVPGLDEKVRVWRPEVVCIVGKMIWDSIRKVKYGKPGKGEVFKYGWQEGMRMGEVKGKDGWEGAKVFVAYSTSCISALPLYPVKLELLTQIGDWIKARRREIAQDTVAEDGTSS